MTVESVGDYLSGRAKSNTSLEDAKGQKSTDLLRKFVQQRKLKRDSHKIRTNNTISHTKSFLI